MKQSYIYGILISAMLVCGIGTVRAQNEVSYLSEIGINDCRVDKEGRKVHVSMHVDMSELRIKSQHTVALTPVLVAKDGSREYAFPPIVIDGGTRNKVYLRAQRLESVDIPPYHDETSNVIIRRRNGEEQTYDYVATADYDRWMLNGSIEMREEVHGCVNCAEGGSRQTYMESVIPEFIPDYRLDVIEPELEPVKVRAENRTARLQFRQDSYNIIPAYKNNRAELDTVSNSIMMVRNNPDVSIIGIYVTGYASPEGTVSHNLKLSENRARALAEYIARLDNIDDDLLHVAWIGEDWDGLRLALEDFPKLLKRDEVYRIIDECTGDHDACEERLKELEPPTIYERMLNEVYPQLRRNEYRVEYNVRNFDPEEARRMMAERPDLLSLSEMYRVAALCEKGSAEYEKVMSVAARYYPESPAVLNDNAMAAIAEGDYNKAVKLLEGAKVTGQNASLLNTLGVAYAGAGEPYKAREAFSRAAEAGLETARHNLGQIENVINQL